jgi:hypothetical protein
LEFFSSIKSTKISLGGGVFTKLLYKKLRKKSPEYDATKTSGQFLHPKKAFLFATSSRNL